MSILRFIARSRGLCLVRV